VHLKFFRRRQKSPLIFVLVKLAALNKVEILPNNEGVELTYEIDSSVPVNQVHDRLKVKFCKTFGNKVCHERLFRVSNGTNTIQLLDDFIVGSWEFVIYYNRQDQLSQASSTATINRCKSFNLKLSFKFFLKVINKFNFFFANIIIIHYMHRFYMQFIVF